MGSHYFGDPNCSGAAGISLSSSSSASRKGKKGGSENPKKPQRGLGVAQLEKIRLHSQLGCNYFPASNFGHHHDDGGTHTAHSLPSSASLTSYGYHGHYGVVMGVPDLSWANAAYGDTEISNLARWHPVNAPYDQHFVEAMITRPFFKSEKEASSGNNSNNNDRDLLGSMALSNHESESKQNSSQEIDLELRLSL